MKLLATSPKLAAPFFIAVGLAFPLLPGCGSDDAVTNVDGGHDSDSAVFDSSVDAKHPAADAHSNADAQQPFDASIEVDAGTDSGTAASDSGSPWYQQAYLKQSNTTPKYPGDFGYASSLSADGNTLVITADEESGAGQGVNAFQKQSSAGDDSGAAYVFVRDSSGTWSQQAYFKASNSSPSLEFGSGAAISADGNTIAIAAAHESSNASGINGNQNDTSVAFSGAVYMFVRDQNNTWTQEAYIKASNAGEGDCFGDRVSLSGDGNTLAASSPWEASGATGVGGNQNDESSAESGAVYTFTRSGTTWSQSAYIKASDTTAGDHFSNPALSADGKTLAVDAYDHNGSRGAVYTFAANGSSWTQQSEITAPNADPKDYFGVSLDLSSDGSTLVVGANGEASNATGTNGNQADNSAADSGAVYVFTRNASTWTLQAYIKASNTDPGDYFAGFVGVSDDGNTLAVGAQGESSVVQGINGNQLNNAASTSGATYLFTRSGSTWTQVAYIKASNTNTQDFFGDLSLSADGHTLVSSATDESSSATGINGNQFDNSLKGAGASYVFTY